MLNYFSWVFDGFSAKEDGVVIEVQAYHLAGIEHPVVMVRKVDRFVPCNVPDILTSPHGELRSPEPKTTMVGEWHTDNSNARKRSALRASFPHHLQPGVRPRQIVWLTGEELPNGLVLIRVVVQVSNLKPERRVLELPEELPEVGARADLLAQLPASSA